MKKFSINPFEKPLASYYSYQKYMKIIGFVFLLIPQISNATFGTVLYNYYKEFDIKWDVNVPIEKIRCMELYGASSGFTYIDEAVRRECHLTLNVATDTDITQLHTSISNLNTELTSKITALENSTNTKFKLMESNVAIEVINKVNTMLMFEPANGKDTLTTEKFRDFIRKIIKEELAKANE